VDAAQRLRPKARKKIENIPNVLSDIFQRAAFVNQDPHNIADLMATETLASAQKSKFYLAGAA